MASFDIGGLDELRLTLEEVADLPDEVVKEMLDAKGQVVKAYQQAELERQGLSPNGKLKGSITVFHKKSRYGQRYALVYPYGTHGQYHRRKVTRVYKNSKHDRTYTVGGDVQETTNNDLGFIFEFGAPKRGITPKQWMRLANAKAEGEAEGAAAAVYDRYLKVKGL